MMRGGATDGWIHWIVCGRPHAAYLSTGSLVILQNALILVEYDPTFDGRPASTVSATLRCTTSRHDLFEALP